MEGDLNLQEFPKLVSFQRKEQQRKKMVVMKNEKHEKVEKIMIF
jgi:hypothetical protein